MGDEGKEAKTGEGVRRRKGEGKGEGLGKHGDG